MSYTDWKDKIGEFQKMDVRHVQGNFFPGIQKRAMSLGVGEGLEIIQTFEPHPLYEALGYAGIKGKNIDAIRMEINGVPGYKILYNVSTTSSNGYLGWVTNYNLANLEDTNNGYAGIYGKPIDKIQIKVVRK